MIFTLLRGGVHLITGSFVTSKMVGLHYGGGSLCSKRKISSGRDSLPDALWSLPEEILFQMRFFSSGRDSLLEEKNLFWKRISSEIEFFSSGREKMFLFRKRISSRIDFSHSGRESLLEETKVHLEENLI